MTLFVRHPVKNIGKMNSYERQVNKYKGGKASQKTEPGKKPRKILKNK
jgi:hypothetical protein